MKFNVLVIDPPWQYRKRETGGSLKSGAAQKYNTLTIKQLEELTPFLMFSIISSYTDIVTKIIEF